MTVEPIIAVHHWKADRKKYAMQTLIFHDDCKLLPGCRYEVSVCLTWYVCATLTMEITVALEEVIPEGRCT